MMFKAFYSSQALELDQWAREEPIRLKASRIYKAAQSLEERYRHGHKNEVDDTYTWPASLPNPAYGLFQY